MNEGRQEKKKFSVHKNKQIHQNVIVFIKLNKNPINAICLHLVSALNLFHPFAIHKPFFFGFFLSLFLHIAVRFENGLSAYIRTTMISRKSP